MEEKIQNILLAGVGGQGIVSLGHLILQSAINSGKKVKGAETHGLSQRGGTVVFHARIGDVMGPLIAKGEADYLVSLELAETVRYVEYLKPNGTLLMSSRTIHPNILQIIGKKYPRLEEIYEVVSKRANKVYVIPTEPMALEIGSARAENLILLGALIKLNPILDYDIVADAVAKRWPKAKEVNLKALKAGYEYLEKTSGATLKETLTKRDTT